MAEIPTPYQEMSEQKKPLSAFEEHQQIVDWVRSCRGKKDFDKTAFIQGLVIKQITADDENEFSTALMFVGSEDVTDSYRNLQKRLTWETDCPELPSEITKELTDVNEYLKTNPWDSKASIEEALHRWKAVRDHIASKVTTKRALDEDAYMFREVDSELITLDDGTVVEKKLPYAQACQYYEAMNYTVKKWAKITS